MCASFYYKFHTDIAKNKHSSSVWYAIDNVYALLAHPPTIKFIFIYSKINKKSLLLMVKQAHKLFIINSLSTRKVIPAEAIPEHIF